MRRLLYFLAFSLTFCTTQTEKKQDFQVLDLAPTPPMGWNSYNTFGIDINEEKVISAADAMVESGMADAGYEYIVIDDGWQIDRDENGRIIADSARFPNGVKHVVDYVHSKGLKFGIYTDMGTKTCGSLPGSYGFEEIDAQTYAEWGVDFIKADWCFTDGLDTKTQYKILSDAIKETGRPMILSICEWGTTSPWEWGKGVGSMWRTTNDIQDCFDCVRSWGGMGWVPLLEKNVDLAPYAGPGHWNDPDMLEVGNRALNAIESKAHFSLWCMLAAPLIAGNDLSKMNDTIRDILTAPELIAIDQDPLGKQGTRLRNENGLQVWQKPLNDGSVAVALLNVSESDAPMYVSLKEIGIKTGEESSVRDLWERQDLEPITDTFKTEVVAHGVVVVKIKGKKATVSELKFDQADVEINKGNKKLIHVTVVPSVTPINVTSADENIVKLTVAGVNTYRLTAMEVGETTIQATTTDGKFSETLHVKINPSSISAPWGFEDISNNKSSANYSDGVFTIEGYGKDIWGGLDQFAFVYQKIENDKSISTRILSQSNPDPWAKTGVMFRESLDANSKFVMICTTPGNGLNMQWRDSIGGSCRKIDLPVENLPVYLKLSKKGSSFNAYKSTDGDNWESISDITLAQPFSEKYLTGLAVVSHSSQFMNLSEFDEVIIGE